MPEDSHDMQADFRFLCCSISRKKLCPNCAHEESKSFKALRNPSKSLRKIFGIFLNGKRKCQLNP